MALLSGEQEERVENLNCRDKKFKTALTFATGCEWVYERDIAVRSALESTEYASDKTAAGHSTLCGTIHTFKMQSVFLSTSNRQ